MALVKRDEISDQWHLLIGNAKGRAEELFNNIEKLLAETEVPDVKVQKRMVAPGILRGLFGGSREFLVVTETENSNLKPYQIFINARDYGNNLDISWYLLFRITFWQKIVLFLCFIPIINILVIPIVVLQRVVLARSSGVSGMDFFDNQDLIAYTQNAHDCVKEATTNLLKDLGRDPEKVDWKSKGFLGIS